MKQILTMTLITCSLFVVACAKKGGQSVSNVPVPPPSDPTQVKSVKVTIANNVERGYKEVDAAQLVGE